MRLTALLLIIVTVIATCTRPLGVHDRFWLLQCHDTELGVIYYCHPNNGYEYEYRTEYSVCTLTPISGLQARRGHTSKTFQLRLIDYPTTTTTIPNATSLGNFFLLID